MPNPNYKAGRAFEYKIAKLWRELHYTVIRSAGSHGFADLMAFCAECPVFAIQCKRVQTRAEARKVIDRLRNPREFPKGKHWRRAVEVYVVKTREHLTEYLDGDPHEY